MLAFQLAVVASALLRASKLDGDDPKAAGKQALDQNPSTCKQQSNNLCDPGNPNAKPILISGSPGSGTHSVVALFEMNGIQLGHESVGASGSVAWPYMVDAKKIYTGFHGDFHSCPWLSPTQTTFRHVFHLVRCPIDVISSMTSHRDCSLNYESRTMGFGTTAPCHKPCTNLAFLGKLWLAQQERLQSYTEGRFRIDEIPIMFQEVCRASGFKPGVCNSQLFPKRAHNQRSHPTVSWLEMKQQAPQVYTQLLAKAKEYGFGEDCTGRSHDLHLAVNESKVAQLDAEAEAVTTGCFGNDANATGDGSETDCSDGLEWVWDRKTLEQALGKKVA
jgi:hypothetical protein